MEADGRKQAATDARGMPESVLGALRSVLGDIRPIPVPIGFALATAFVMPDGDRLALYACGPDAEDCWTLVDDGMRLPMLEASGFTGPDADAAVARLTGQFGTRADRDGLEVTAGPVPPSRIAEAASGLVATLLGLNALSLVERTHP